ncbi:MAG: ABC transporter permease [Clostridiales bacterium]|nr:ABC transporter permease [Clostridiales bacterium]
MFKFLSHKLLNKKWLNACLLLGIVLLVAVASCNPMFKNGALDMLMSSKFDAAMVEQNKYPCTIGRAGSCAVEDYADTGAVLDRISKYEDMWKYYLELDTIENQISVSVQGGYTQSNLGHRTFFNMVYMPGLEDHINITHGIGLDEAKTEDGVYPCIISQRYLDTYNLVVGETFTIDSSLSDAVDSQGNPMKYRIVGVFEEKDYSDNYWYDQLAGMEKQVYVKQADLDDMISKYGFLTIYYTANDMLDYSQITHSNASDILYYVKAFEKSDKSFTQNFTSVLIDYKGDAKTIGIIIWVLELPILVLLLAFIYMVSSQILEMEDGEIAMLKSRGTSTRQILGIYFGQSAILSVIAIIIGMPIGYLLCKMAASTSSFLKFSVNDTHFYGIDPWMLVYSVVAALIAILFVTLPVFKYAKNSIVEQKSKTGRVNYKPFWEKFFVDVILVALSVYLLYNYNKQKSAIALDILAGSRPDPVIFLNSSLFIFAVGLLVLRLIKYLIRLIYRIGRKKWSPAVYASFLQITRTVKKQGFISVFLVMTIAMGMFNSNMARTINDNKTKRIDYNVGTDLVVQEQWTRGTYIDKDKKAHWYYNEGDFERYTKLEGSLCDKVTRVIYDDNAVVKAGGEELGNSVLMGINTKEFGETAELQSGLNKEHWYNYLNDLAQVSNGVIISSNLASKYNIKVGDTINYGRYSPLKEKELIATPSGTVCAIVDAFPGFQQYVYQKNADGEMEEIERYLVVANYAYVVGAFSQTPYQVWMKLSKGTSYKDVLQTLRESDINIVQYDSCENDIQEMQESPLVLITNGLFSLSFIIAIILCTVGFLIYWITSIKQRELLFGIYRAMGMSMREINKMLINEQIFSSVLASLAGYGVGVAATVLFVKLVSIVYLPESHNIAIAIAVNPYDTVKLTVVVVFMFVVCFVVIRTILKKMNITQALKLGED